MNLVEQGALFFLIEEQGALHSSETLCARMAAACSAPDGTEVELLRQGGLEVELLLDGAARKAAAVRGEELLLHMLHPGSDGVGPVDEGSGLGVPRGALERRLGSPGGEAEAAAAGGGVAVLEDEPHGGEGVGPGEAERYSSASETGRQRK
jgi:hypothetical protein